MPSTAVRMIGRTAASYDLRVGSSATGSTTSQADGGDQHHLGDHRDPRVVSIWVDLMPSRRTTPGEPQRPPNDATSQWPAPAPCPTAPCPRQITAVGGAKPTRLRLLHVAAVHIALRHLGRSSTTKPVVTPCAGRGASDINVHSTSAGSPHEADRRRILERQPGGAATRTTSPQKPSDNCSSQYLGIVFSAWMTRRLAAPESSQCPVTSTEALLNKRTDWRCNSRP